MPLSRRNKSVNIFQAEIFYSVQFPSVKPSTIFFFVTDRLSDGIRYYRRTVCRRKFSIGDLVGKKITDELWISYQWNLSVGKTVKSCSVLIYHIYVYACPFFSIWKKPQVIPYYTEWIYVLWFKSKSWKKKMKFAPIRSKKSKSN
jgi:hypothetical protein